MSAVRLAGKAWARACGQHHEEGMRQMQQPGSQGRLRRYWDRHARPYDRQMGFFDRHLFAGSRDWIYPGPLGRVLEVAVGTGLNLAHYPDEVQLTGWSGARR